MLKSKINALKVAIVIIIVLTSIIGVLIVGIVKSTYDINDGYRQGRILCSNHGDIHTLYNQEKIVHCNDHTVFNLE